MLSHLDVRGMRREGRNPRDRVLRIVIQVPVQVIRSTNRELTRAEEIAP